MPAYEPGGRLAIVLDVDAAKDPAPSFIVTALSARESMTLLASLDGALETGGTVQQFEFLEGLLKQHVHGWKNIDAAFAPDSIADVLNISDMWRLAYAIGRQVGIPEKKA